MLTLISAFQINRAYRIFQVRLSPNYACCSLYVSVVVRQLPFYYPNLKTFFCLHRDVTILFLLTASAQQTSFRLDGNIEPLFHFTTMRNDLSASLTSEKIAFRNTGIHSGHPKNIWLNYSTIFDAPLQHMCLTSLGTWIKKLLYS